MSLLCAIDQVQTRPKRRGRGEGVGGERIRLLDWLIRQQFVNTRPRLLSAASLASRSATTIPFLFVFFFSSFFLFIFPSFFLFKTGTCNKFSSLSLRRCRRDWYVRRACIGRRNIYVFSLFLFCICVCVGVCVCVCVWTSAPGRPHDQKLHFIKLIWDRFGMIIPAI